MDRTNVFDEYVKENEINREKLSDSEYYFDALQDRINGSKTIDEVKNEVYQFLINYSVPDPISEQLMAICDDFTPNMDVSSAIWELKDYLKSLISEQKDEFEQSNSEVDQIKTEFVDDSIQQLEEAGVSVVGNTDELIDDIENQADIEKIQNNVDTAIRYMDERNKIDTYPIDISVDQLQNSLDSSGDEHILDAIEEIEEKQAPVNDPDISFSDDGTAYCQVEKGDNATEQFALMMLGTLMVAESNQDLFQNLGVKLIKDQEDDNAFRFEFGNFPLTNHPENRLDAVAKNRIQELAQQFQPNIDYMPFLLQQAPEIALMYQIFDQHILGNDGAATLGIKRSADHFHFSLSMDENYQQVSDAFRTNNATVNETSTGKNLISVSKETTAEQLVLLQDTEATLLSMKEELSQSNELHNTSGAYVKTYVPPVPSSESGQISPKILLMVVSLEVIAVLVSFLFAI